ncbi:MAG TPA: RluA family pseudouridine synthase [Acidimicrobiales bacterium]|nr:RluA family pseudouridine synthase [Acidimicrobiales bacterium]
MRLVAPAALAGERVDRAVAFVTGLSRQRAADLIAGGNVEVDGAVVTDRSVRLTGGEVLEISDWEAVTASTAAESGVEFGVVHEDDDVIIVDKPPGLVVHPGAGRSSGTLVNGLVQRWPEIAAVGDPARPGIVHRLDGGTSGLMAVARTQVAYDSLISAMKARAVEREYSALGWGTVKADRGLVDAKLGRSKRDRTRMAVTADGREARTQFAVEKRFTTPVATTLLACVLETGRTHQIRVHLAAIGHPVVGDDRYGRSRPGLECPRPFLHARRLSFDHPVTGERVTASSALPADLEGVLARLS